MTLSGAIDRFLEHLEIERNVSKLTIRNYRHYLLRFLDFLSTQQTTIQTPQDISGETIRLYRLYLSRTVSPAGIPLKRVTQSYHLIALRSLLRFLSRLDIASMPAEKIDLPKGESKSLRFLTRQQIERLLSMPEISNESGLRDKAILEVLFSTGLRVSELVRLNRDSINFDTNEFGVVGKGGRARVVFLSDAASAWVKRYVGQRSDSFKPLFIRYAGRLSTRSEGEGVRLTTRSIQRIVEKYAKAARVPVKITPHGLRHSFATDLLSGGADLRSIQEMLGHKNIATTQIYTHVTNPQLRDVHHKFHRRTSS